MVTKDIFSINLLLASSSPRRKELLQAAGLELQVQPVDVPEPVLPGESGHEMVCRLAEEKAQAALENFIDGQIVLAADTTVLHAGQIIGKPADEAEAIDMLLRLRQGSHRVISAVTLVERASGTKLTTATKTDLFMRGYDRNEVKQYVASGSPLDKAGAYGIQDEAFMPVDMARFEGCFTNVMGLPLCSLGLMLAAMGFAGADALIEVCFDYHRHELQPIGELLNA